MLILAQHHNFDLRACSLRHKTAELNWTELNWTDLNWTELIWTELNWTELKWIVICKSKSIVKSWIELNWTGLNWTELNWIELNWIELNWTELNWTKLNWTENKMGRTGPNSYLGHQNWAIPKHDMFFLPFLRGSWAQKLKSLQSDFLCLFTIDLFQKL